MVVPDVLMQLAQALDLIALKYGALGISLAMFAESAGTVSYTHLDVYKRQGIWGVYSLLQDFRED